MRLIFTFILYILTTFFSDSFAQLNKSGKIALPNKQSVTNANSSSQKVQLTGIWRGYFIQREYNPFTQEYVFADKYKYEVQINLLANSALEGVTYSYQDTRFYGKASLNGIFTTKTKNIIIKELKMLELKISGENSEPCLMTCYLDYSKVGNKEILKGDYSSIKVRNKADCGDGIVYLEKVTETDFVKEDFLLKKPTAKLNTLPKKIAPTTARNNIETKKIADTASLKSKNKIKPGAEDALVKKEKNTPVSETKKEATPIVKKEETPKTTSPNPVVILPKVLTERKNNLIKTLYVDEGELQIELYDNGQIDNDTISIYHNGKPVLLKGRLSSSPLKFTISVSAKDPIHELIMIADNLGEIPPNTSLMVVTAGKKRYEVFLTSDLEKNAKLIFEYKPQQDNSKK